MNENNKKILNQAMIVFGFIMVAVYLLLGFVLIFGNYFKSIPQEYKTVFAFFFIAYGFFRLVRSVSKLKEHQDYYNIEQ